MRKSNLSHRSSSLKHFSQIHQANSMKTISRLNPDIKIKNTSKTIDFTDTFRKLGKKNKLSQSKCVTKQKQLNIQFTNLNKQNEKIKREIESYKNDIQGNRQNIKKILKNLTMKKLGMVKAKINQQQKIKKIDDKKSCQCSCRPDIELQKQLIRLKLKRYELENQRNQFLRWEQNKIKEFNQLRKQIQDLKQQSKQDQSLFPLS